MSSVKNPQINGVDLRAVRFLALCCIFSCVLGVSWLLVFPPCRSDPRSELVKFRLFAGLTISEIARVMRIPLATAERHGTYARTWLSAELKNRGHSEKILRIFPES
jgi:hypothetical protein